MTHLSVLVTLAFLLIPRTSWAEPSDRDNEEIRGHHVLTTVDGSQTMGRIVSINRDTLEFVSQLGSFRVPLSKIAEIQARLRSEPRQTIREDMGMVARDEGFPDQDVYRPRFGYKNPQTALAFSAGFGLLLFDGAGQFYNGEHGKGTLFLVWSFFSKAMWCSGQSQGESDSAARNRAIVGLISNAASYTTAMIDAYRSAGRINRKLGYAPKMVVGVGPVGSRAEMGLLAGVTF